MEKVKGSGEVIWLPSIDDKLKFFEKLGNGLTVFLRFDIEKYDPISSVGTIVVPCIIGGLSLEEGWIITWDDFIVSCRLVCVWNIVISDVVNCELWINNSEKQPGSSIVFWDIKVWDLLDMELVSDVENVSNSNVEEWIIKMSLFVCV